MAGKGGSAKGIKHNYPVKMQDGKFYRHLISDIKANGIGYVKSFSTMQMLAEKEPNLVYDYNKQDELYHVRYIEGTN